MNTIKKEEMVKNSNQSKITLSHYKQIGIDLLKDELKELRSGEDFWKFSMKTKGISVTKMKWKGVVAYDSIEEYEEDGQVAVVACDLVNRYSYKNRDSIKVHYIAVKYYYEGMGYA